MTSRACCVPECTVTQSKGHPLHRFPDPNKLDENERFHRWVMNIGGEILSQDNGFIHKNRRICHRHFIDIYRFDNNRLSKLAIPTLNIPGHSLPSKGQTELDKQDTTERPATPAETVEPLTSEQETSVISVSPTVEHFQQAAFVEEEAAHDNVSCDNCDAKVYGFRYKCVECADYDLCSSCEARGAHPNHYVLRIPQPLQFGHAKLLIDRLRQSLADEGLCQKRALPQAENLQEIDRKGGETMDSIKLELREEINLKEQENSLIDAEVNAVLALTKDPLDLAEDVFSNFLNEVKANDASPVQTIGVTKYANNTKRKSDLDPNVSRVEKSKIYNKKAKTEDLNEPPSSKNSQSFVLAQNPHVLLERCHIIQKSPLSGRNRNGS